MKFKKGFTLIELLVVIAIIGVLAAIIMAGLSNSRKKGADAAVKSALMNARSQAELYYSYNSDSYTGVCGTTAVAGVKPIGDIVLSAATSTGLSSITVNGTGTTSTATCNTNGTAWAAEAPVKAISGSLMYCVDSTGASKAKTASIGAGFAC